MNISKLRAVRRDRLARTALLGGLVLGLAACGGDDAAPTTADVPAPAAAARLVDADGAERGRVTWTETSGGLRVDVRAEGLEPGTHGFHVHTVGACEPDSADPEDASETGDFLSAGGHLAPGDQSHGDHTGDMPSLEAAADGSASMTHVTDRITTRDLLDDDGSAVMVHEDPDNFANVPERYDADGPDQDTLDTGDSGDREACGVVAAG